MAYVASGPVGGLFALVSYIPGELGLFLDDFRRSLGGVNIDARAHITLLPPRPLLISVPAAKDLIRSELLPFSAFDVELEGMRTFEGTQVIYVNVGTGNRIIREIHSHLSIGVFAHPEPFEFWPHVTVLQPESTTRAVPLDALERQWAAVTINKQFRLNEVVLLWLKPQGTEREWQRLCSFPLPSQSVYRASNISS